MSLSSGSVDVSTANAMLGTLLKSKNNLAASRSKRLILWITPLRSGSTHMCVLEQTASDEYESLRVVLRLN